MEVNTSIIPYTTPLPYRGAPPMREGEFNIHKIPFPWGAPGRGPGAIGYDIHYGTWIPGCSRSPPPKGNTTFLSPTALPSLPVGVTWN